MSFRFASARTAQIEIPWSSLSTHRFCPVLPRSVRLGPVLSLPLGAPVASLQYFRESSIVASHRNLRLVHPLFQARLTVGLIAASFFATARDSSRPVSVRIFLSNAAGLMHLNAAFILMIGRFRIFSWLIARWWGRLRSVMFLRDVRSHTCFRHHLLPGQQIVREHPVEFLDLVEQLQLGRNAIAQISD